MKDNEIKSWEQAERSVTLTNDQWNTLICYILGSTNYRKGEREAWESLASEKNEDGTPIYKNAVSNAEYYKKLEVELMKIKDTIDDYVLGRRD